MRDSNYGPHESWCDTQNNISTTCNCLAATYIDQIGELRCAISMAIAALEKYPPLNGAQ